MKQYTPRPGSLPDRLIAHLATRPKGQQRMTNTDIAERFDVHIKNVIPVLKAAVNNDVLTRYQDPNSRRTGYQLGDTLPGAAVPPLREQIAAEGAAPIVRRTIGAAKAKRTGVAAQGSAAASPLQFTRWHDDDIGITGAQLGEGDVVILTRADIRALVDFVTQPHTPAPSPYPF